ASAPTMRKGTPARAGALGQSKTPITPAAAFSASHASFTLASVCTLSDKTPRIPFSVVRFGDPLCISD
ncbi:MAG: hypothetical protein ACREVR_21715, partial [Burkholderiales bacterium]